MHWKTVRAAEPDFVAVVFLKDSLPCKLNLCRFPRLTLVAYVRHTQLSSSTEFPPHSCYRKLRRCFIDEGTKWVASDVSLGWRLWHLHREQHQALYSVADYFRNPFFPTTYLGRFFFLPTIIWLQLQSLKSFTWLWLCSAISPFPTPTPPFVLLPYFYSSCDYVLWL